MGPDVRKSKPEPKFGTSFKFETESKWMKNYAAQGELEENNQSKDQMVTA